jgi:hypothetical protein
LDESQKAISGFHKADNLRAVNFYIPTVQEYRRTSEEREKKARDLLNHVLLAGKVDEFISKSVKTPSIKSSDEPVRIKKMSLHHFSTRNFCSKPEPEEPKKLGGFAQYLRKLIQVDKTKSEEDEKKAKDLESIISKDPSEIKIGFQKIKSSVTLDESKSRIPQTEAAEEEKVDVDKALKREQELVIKANERFGIDFYKEFSLSDEKLMQVSIEEYISDVSKEDIPLFAASLVSNAYELSPWIPNTHILFYKIFCSPITNKEERAKQEKVDLN